MEKQGFLHRRQSLQGRFRMMAVGVVLLMLLMGAVSIALVTSSTRSMQQILARNQAAFNLQQAMSSETLAFKEYAQGRGDEARAVYENAKHHTQEVLDAVPFDYDEIGENRYEITWTIRSSYESYCTARDAVLEMEPEGEEYINALYKVYARQEYIVRYCGTLVDRVLKESAADYSRASSFYRLLPYLVMGVELAALIALLGFLYSSIGAIFNGLGQLAAASHNIEENVFDSPDIEWSREDEMGDLVRAFNKMKHATGQNFAMQKRLHQEELERVELERRFSAAQFQALKNQLNPHFLFNTLNTIARMAKIEGAPTSEKMTLAVSNLLRYNLRTNDPLVPLAQELKVVDDYMYIQQMRFGDRIRCRVDCTVDTAALVPCFLLQPLVENAIQHGLHEVEEGGLICVWVRSSGQRLRIAVADNGTGMAAGRLAEVRRAMKRGDSSMGIGLCNLEKRITGLYEDGAASVYSRPGGGTVVFVEFGAAKPGFLPQQKSEAEN